MQLNYLKKDLNKMKFIYKLYIKDKLMKFKN